MSTQTRKPKKAKTWSWLIPPDKKGNPIDQESANALLEDLGSQFRFYLVREGNNKLPKYLKVIEPHDPLLENTRILFLRNKLNIPQVVLNQMSAFINGFLCHREYTTPKN
jgi:hypothetical protein